MLPSQGVSKSLVCLNVTTIQYFIVKNGWISKWEKDLVTISGILLFGHREVNATTTFDVWFPWNVKSGRIGQFNQIFWVHDGKVWEEFQLFHEEPFLSSPFSFRLTLNLDHSSTPSTLLELYTKFALKLAIQARVCKFNWCLPGPSEPSNINFFLEPLVKELKEFWEGKELHVSEQSSKKKVRCALLCTACDLPAGRKLCFSFVHCTSGLFMLP